MYLNLRFGATFLVATLLVSFLPLSSVAAVVFRYRVDGYDGLTAQRTETYRQCDACLRVSHAPSNLFATYRGELPSSWWLRRWGGGTECNGVFKYWDRGEDPGFYPNDRRWRYGLYYGDGSELSSVVISCDQLYPAQYSTFVSSGQSARGAYVVGKNIDVRVRVRKDSAPAKRSISAYEMEALHRQLEWDETYWNLPSWGKVETLCLILASPEIYDSPPAKEVVSASDYAYYAAIAVQAHLQWQHPDGEDVKAEFGIPDLEDNHPDVIYLADLVSDFLGFLPVPVAASSFGAVKALYAPDGRQP